MRNYLFVTIILLFGVLLAACNSTTSEPDPVVEEESIETPADETNDEQAPLDKPTAGTTETPEDTVEKPVDKPVPNDKQPTTNEQDINDKQDTTQPTKQENTPTKPKKPTNDKANEKAEAEKQAAADKQAEEKVAKEQAKEAKQREEAEKKAEAEKNSEKSTIDQVIDLTNQARKNAGLAPLIKDGNLTKAAQAKSIDMRENNSMEHESPQYGGLGGILNQHGVSYSMAGENIAHGQPSPEAVVEVWMNSADHQANILNPNFTHIGVGYEGQYWTQQFIKE